MKYWMSSGRKPISPTKDYDMFVENSVKNFAADLVTFKIMIDILRFSKYVSCSCCWKRSAFLETCTFQSVPTV